ncbi:ATP-dependent nuclease [Nocardia gipuzkoensis]
MVEQSADGTERIPEFSIWVSALEFSDRSEFEIPKSGVVILAGPNNAGKSQALKDIFGLARRNISNYQARTIKRSVLMKESSSDISAWLKSNLSPVMREGVPHYHVEGWSIVQESAILSQWPADDYLGHLATLFMLLADGTSRLTAGNSQSNIDFSVDPATHPVQHAYNDPDLERKLGEMCRAAFGADVTVDRFGGSMISLRIGERPPFSHNSGVPTADYLRSLKKLPKLEEQGDGIRSYMGLVLHILAGRHEIMLVDEPEAFLHPPQARLLGKVLAEQAKNKQVFLSTHSSSIVQGALEAGASTTIVRITRDGGINHAAMLRDEDVKELWSDPLLRYSNVLDGLFHDVVVLCESDSDCRYYQAVLDGVTSTDLEGSKSREPQLLFTHCGGKGRLNSVVKALRAVSVPVVIIADFDLLREKADVEKLVAVVNGDMSLISSDLALLSNQLNSGTKPLRKLPLREEINKRIDAIEGDVVDTRAANNIRAAIKAENGWDKVKQSGLSAVPQGDAYAAAERLLSTMKSMGILVVPVGELEGFARSVGGHGPSWVTGVLERDLHLNPGKEAKEFVESIRDTAIAAMSATASKSTVVST